MAKGFFVTRTWISVDVLTVGGTSSRGDLMAIAFIPRIDDRADRVIPSDRSPGGTEERSGLQDGPEDGGEPDVEEVRDVVGDGRQDADEG